MPSSAASSTVLVARPHRTRRRLGLAVIGIALATAAPWLAAAPASATAGPLPLGDRTSAMARGFADVRAAARPGALALSAAARAQPHRVQPASALVGATTTYYALQPTGVGADLVRFRTDGRARVSGRTVLSAGTDGTVVAPTSAVGGTLVAMEASWRGQNLVTVDPRGRVRRLTSDGRSSYGLLTPQKRVVFVTNDALGEANGLDEVDATGRNRRTVFRENDRDAVLSLPALSPNGRTAYLVRNVFDRRGLPQSSMLTIDLRTRKVTSRPLPGINFVVSVSAGTNGRDLAFVGYRASENQYARWVGFRAEADVLPVSGGVARRVAWVSDPFVVFSRGNSRLVVGAEGRLVSVGVATPAWTPLYGTEGLSLPVLAR